MTSVVFGLVLAFTNSVNAAPPGAVIENQAVIEFTNAAGNPDAQASNTVQLTTAVLRTPATVELTRVLTAGSGLYAESVGPSACFQSGAFVDLADPQLVGGTVIDPGVSQQINVSPAYNLGEPVFIRLNDGDQNLDFQVIDTATVTLTSTATGDVETIRLSETGLDTGVFSGYLPSVGAAAVSGDCVLQAAANTDIRVDYVDPADATDTANTLAVVDPTQRVFETRTGSVVTGSIVELIDAATGQPATVFGNDGVSQFPSSVVSGGTTTDSSGTVYVFAPGEYRFPVVPDGDYRLVVTPPPQFTAPSVAAPADLQSLPGAPFEISDASFGVAFTKTGGLSFAVDIPVDPNASQLFLQKQTLTTTAAPGDFIRYELVLENTGTAGVASQLRIVDALPSGLRYVEGSTRINGQEADDPTIDAVTGTLEFLLDPLTASRSVTIAYVVELVSAKRGDSLINRATAEAAGGLASNEAQVAIQVTEDLFRSTGTLLGRVVEGECTAESFSEEQGVAGVRVYLEDGRYAVSDEGGRFHFEGLKAGTHVVQLDRFTVPEYFDIVGCDINAREAGRPDSQFVKLSRGSLLTSNFYLKRKPAPEGRIELELSAKSGGSAESVVYELEMDGIGNVDISNIDLMVVLPDGVNYESGSLLIDGQHLGNPRNMNRAISMALPDRSGNWDSMLEFRVTIDADVSGELSTRAIATFDTPIAAKQRTPVAETRMQREPATVKNAGYVLDLKFDVLSDELSSGDIAKLDALLADWRGVGDIRINAIGHSDSQAISPRNRQLFADNYALSRARALSAASYLGAMLQVSADDIQVDGRGPDDPVASNATAEGRQQNRRVELILSGVRPSTPSFLEVTKETSGAQAAATKGAVPGSQQKNDNRFRVDPEAGTPKSQLVADIQQLGAGYAMLHPASDFMPAIPATKVSIQHRPGQTVELTVNGRPVSALNFEATALNRAETVAVSRWRTAALDDGENTLRAEIVDANGDLVEVITRTLYYAGPPVRAEVVPDRSNLIADGRTRPALAIRLFDRSGRPARPGMTGNFQVRDPYRSWFDVEESRANQLMRLNDRQSHYRIGKGGMAFIELEPTTRSGELLVELEFENQREQEVRGWLTPAARDWILVGFAEGTAAHTTLSDNMQAALSAGFEEDFSEQGRIAFFAKGQIRGDYLLTLAYDSDRERDLSRLETVVDPNEYYPLYADASEQRFDAASQRKLYLRLERDQFFALFGDIDTGLSVTELARYERRLNGFKSGFRGDNVAYTVFAAETSQGFNRDELRGDGTSGLYRLSRAPIIANSEQVRIEVRDRFDSGQIVSSRTLTRFLDYNLDPLNGTLFFKQPVQSRDTDFNPIYIVVEYESRTSDDDAIVAGGRGSVHSLDDRVEVGATFITDETSGAETELRGVDLRWQVTPETLIRAEYASTDTTVGSTTQSGSAQKIELEHTSERARVRAFIREVEDGFGLGNQAAADQGVRRLGVEGEGQISDRFSIRGEAAWQQQLETEDIRNLVRGAVQYEHGNFNATVGLMHAEDKFEDGDSRVSDLAEVGVSQRILDGRVLLRASTTSALSGTADSADFPDTMVVGTDIRLGSKVELLTEYERSEGRDIESQMTRVGLRATPWQRAQLQTTLNNELSEYGPRLFANVGLVQGIQLGERWLLDIGIDQSNTLASDELRQLDPDRELVSGSLDDDFTAAFIGAMYNSELWSANARVEHRNSDNEERMSLLFGWYREPVRGHGLSAGLTVFETESANGAQATQADLTFGWAWRKADSDWTFLDRADLVYESAESPTAEQRSWRFINNFNANRQFGERMQLSLQYAFKYVRSEFDGDAYTGYTDLAGFDLRRSLNHRWDAGINASVLSSYESDVRDYSVGFDVGFNLATNLWLSLGYNVAGFSDDDLSRARYTAQGPYLRFAMKADQRLLKNIANRR
ncbi:MAG: OmpA family protein [Pseudomonadota bacterium]